jgi:UDP:flavonoid glycosyltransferase YjiC (YdhE family)
MRILFTTQPAVGHFHPLVPLARALEAAGHRAAFATARSFCPTVEAGGFRCFPAGLDWSEAEAEREFPQLRDLPPGPEQDHFWGQQIFYGRALERFVPDLLGLIGAWRPDVVVREPFEPGGVFAAEYCGLPHATAGAGFFMPPDALRRYAGPPFAALRRSYGMPPDPEVRAPYRYLDLSFTPPRFLDASDYVAPVVHFLRPVPFDRSGAEVLPPWVADVPARPTVYATMGTVFNRTPGRFEAILAGVAGEPITLILAVGRNQDPEQFGPQPSNVRVTRYIPQSLLLPHCDLVITHGGFNTIMGALSQGLPLVIIPVGADQPSNARRCAGLGVGRVVTPEQRTPEGIRAAVDAVLHDQSYRTNSRVFRGEMAALPGPEHGVALLERLVVERRPIMATE